MLLLCEICFWEISLCVWDISHSDRDIFRKKNIDLETVVRVSILHFLYLVNYLTINQQFGHEAKENRNGQWQVMSASGQAF